MLTVDGVANSGPGLLTETICVGIAGTIPEAGGRGFGGSLYLLRPVGDLRRSQGPY